MYPLGTIISLVFPLLTENSCDLTFGTRTGDKHPPKPLLGNACVGIRQLMCFVDPTVPDRRVNTSRSLPARVV